MAKGNKYPNTSGLIKLKPKGDPRSDKIRAKLKGSSSPKRKAAQALSRIPMMSPDTLKKRALELSADPDASSTLIMSYISKLLEKPGLSISDQNQAIRTLISAHSAIHGSKQKISSTSLSVHANINEELSQLLADTRNGVGISLGAMKGQVPISLDPIIDLPAQAKTVEVVKANDSTKTVEAPAPVELVEEIEEVEKGDEDDSVYL